MFWAESPHGSLQDLEGLAILLPLGKPAGSRGGPYKGLLHLAASFLLPESFCLLVPPCVLEHFWNVLPTSPLPQYLLFISPLLPGM